MRLTLVIASLGQGGAERTASALANAWAQQGHNVTLITLVRDDVPAFALYPAVVLRQLKVRSGVTHNILHGLFRQFRSVRVLRRALRESEPDLVISFMDIPNVLTILAARGFPAPVVITEHIHPAHYHIGWHWQALRRLVYHRADNLVCVSRPLLEWFLARTQVRGRVIPNPVALPLTNSVSSKRVEKDSNGHVVLGMGRLVEQKGFDLLLAAFARIAERHPDWSLKILGGGPLLGQLQAQAQNLGLQGRVEFTGALADPFPVMRAADLFVFSSRFEGFGNALCEAMACGLPAISFDCPSGPSDIIRPGVDGVLVPAQDVAALAESMDRLMSDEPERLKLAARAPEVLSRFGMPKILELWQQLFDDLVAAKPKRGVSDGR